MIKFIRIFIVVLFFSLVGGAITSYKLIPFSDIHKLKKGHVSFTLVDGRPKYSIVQSRPENWVNLSLMSDSAWQGIQINEDWSFFDHSGIDLTQLWTAIYEHLVYNRPLRGASTISQQLVKNLFLSSDRSYIRKVKEALITLYLDATLTKEKVLETYLNIIEYGDGIYGIGIASKHYFKVHPANLSPRQGAFLAMLLPNPKVYSKSYQNKLMTPFAEYTIHKILHKMKVARFIDESTEQKESSTVFEWELSSGDLLHF